MSREEAAEKIHDLADKISEGEVELKSGKDSVDLQISDKVEFELDVEEENDGETSIEIEIEWKKDSTGEVEIS